MPDVESRKNDAALIAEYRKRHSEGKVWPETLAAIREVGILEMEIMEFRLEIISSIKN